MYITVRPLSAWKKKGEDTRMVEKEVILRRLTLLEEYCNDLEEAKRNISWERFSQNKVFKRYIERTLQMAIEACLDIGNHIISYEGYREPVDNKDVFEVLHEQMIINEELKDRLKKWSNFAMLLFMIMFVYCLKLFTPFLQVIWQIFWNLQLQLRIDT
jgi:uncharacterized protein YutE (UPF0331/DUF86 family)